MIYRIRFVLQIPKILLILLILSKFDLNVFQEPSPIPVSPCPRLP